MEAIDTMSNNIGKIGNVASSAGTTTAPKQSEFDREGMKLFKNIEVLRVKISVLEGRIQPILRSITPPIKENDAEISQKVETNLAQFIREQSDSIKLMHELLGSIIDRVEI